MRFAVVLALIGCKYSAPIAVTNGDAPGADDGAITVDVPPGTWLEPFTHRRVVTLSASQVTVPSGGLIDFPVLVASDVTGIGTASLAAGADVVFTDSSGVQLLDSELELLAVDRVAAWVKVPTLSNVADTQLFMYYGNPNPPPTNPTAVWADYRAVWHLNQNPGPGGAGEILDSTANNRAGTATASMDNDDAVRGHIGQALRFDDSDNAFIEVPAMMNVGTGFTISAWINVDPAANDLITILSNSLSGLDQDGFRLFVNSSTTTDRRLLFETSNGGAGGADLAVTNTNAITFGTWVHVAVVVDRTAGIARLFVDGVDLTIDQSIRTMFKIDSDHEIGRMGDLFEWEGMLDELEISSAKQPPEWIKTTFDNQKAGSTFVVIGAEEAAP